MRAYLLLPLLVLLGWQTPSRPGDCRSLPGAHYGVADFAREPLAAPVERSASFQKLTESPLQAALSGAGKSLKLILNPALVLAQDLSGVCRALIMDVAHVRFIGSLPSTPRAPPAPPRF
jgi:hypothetical protein